MKKKELTNYLTKVAEEKNISLDSVIDAFKFGLEAGCRKEHGVFSCRADINTEKNEIFVYKQYEVINPETFNYQQVGREDRKKISYMSLEEAKKHSKKIKVGEILELLVNPSEYNLDAAKEVKNRFNEQLNKAYMKSLFDFYQSKLKKLITGRVISIEQRGYRLDIGNDFTTLLNFDNCLNTIVDKTNNKKNLIDNFHIGDRVNVTVTDVILDEKNKLSVKVSRNEEDLVKELLLNNVPEIKDGIVLIKGISRKAGERSKVGVISTKEGIDAIGSCIGEQGSRIRGVKKALNGENIDLFLWSEVPKELIANALQPAEVIAVVNIDPISKEAHAIVKDNQLSLAIGKDGINATLAAKAIKWDKITVHSEESAKNNPDIIY